MEFLEIFLFFGITVPIYTMAQKNYLPQFTICKLII